MPVPATPQQNHLLAALSIQAGNRIFPTLKLIYLPSGKIFNRSGDAFHSIYFPIDSVISFLNITRDGATTAVAMIGNEGMTGLTVFIGGLNACDQKIVQTGGTAFEMDAKVLRDELGRSTEIEELLLRYTQARITQMAQVVVCNRFHTIDQQLCCWLLSTLDRIQDNRINITQELISHILGVRRESVTLSAHKLQRQGIISYHRGHILVLNRSRLERLSCECYQIVNRETRRLLHHTVHPATSAARMQARA